MTAKDKAIEIVKDHDYDTQSALVAISNIILLLQNDDISYDGEYLDFWQEVKQEIEKL